MERLGPEVHGATLAAALAATLAVARVERTGRELDEGAEVEVLGADVGTGRVDDCPEVLAEMREAEGVTGPADDPGAGPTPN